MCSMSCGAAQARPGPLPGLLRPGSVALQHSSAARTWDLGAAGLSPCGGPWGLSNGLDSCAEADWEISKERGLPQEGCT